jgi:spore coat polysaccharide biosynthesis protein SpsF
VDTEEDFQVVETIYNHHKEEYVSAKKIIEFLDNHPKISEINNGVNQKDE